MFRNVPRTFVAHSAGQVLVYFALDVRVAATASRALPAVASHAIGFAEARPGDQSLGFGAYEANGENRLDICR